MKRKFRRLVHNPFFVVLPLVLVLAFGWQHYTFATRDNTLSKATSNLLPNADFATAGANGLPTGWALGGSSQAHVAATFEHGYVSGRTAVISVSDYDRGDITISSPKIAIKSHQTYLFKGYYTTTTRFTVLRRTFYADGTQQLKVLRDYVPEKTTWSTVGDAFDTAGTIQAVQYVYRVSTNGTVKINGVYLEPRQDVYIAPGPAGGANLMPNAELATSTLQMPDSWLSYENGDNTVQFALAQDGTLPYLHVECSAYTSGEAKWQFDPIPTSSQKAYEVSFRYRSDVTTNVIAEYGYAEGHDSFETLAGIAPASDWTDVTLKLETPPGATSVFVSVVLQAKGYVDTSNYSLVDMTKAGAAAWKEPLASITFDDGWESVIKNALPTLDSYGFKATYYVNPATIEISQHMSAQDLADLKQHGNEIASHGYDHDDMTAISADKLSYELQQGRDYLTQAGYPTNAMATPYGKSDPQVQYYARKFYTMLRSTRGSVNTRQSFDPYDLQVLYIDEHTTDDNLRARLQKAKDFHGWVILVYHAVGSKHDVLDSEPTPALPTAVFQRQIKIIHDSGIAVKTVAEAFQEVSNQ